MAKMTLTYFDMPVSRGEECRLALFLAGVPFTDERLKPAEWEKRKASTPYGALPILTAEGHKPVAQSNAILRLIGSLHGLHPADPWEAARHEALMGAIEDFRVRLSQVRQIKEPAAAKQAREEFARGYMQEWGGHVEAQLGDPFVGGGAIQVVDLKLFVAQTPIRNGTMDHIAADVFKAFPQMTRQFEAVRTHPKVVAWQNR